LKLSCLEEVKGSIYIDQYTSFKRKIAMTKRMFLTLLFIVLMLVPLSLYLAGCGSGGGESGTVTPIESTSTGSVTVLIADGPADDYDSIVITVTEVSLIPAEEDADPVVIYESDGEEIDLLKYRDEDLVFTVNNDVPAGDYEKVRLRVSDIRSEGGPCDELSIKLPSGKIDLNPGETFTVAEDTALLIRLDIDANKSLQLHQAGKSGKCIFRPVVFVEIAPTMKYCTSILTGTISEFLTDTDGFIIELSEGQGELEVHIVEDTVIFDSEGRRLVFSELALGQEVVLKGWLYGEGYLQATFVVVGNGEVLVLEGEVKGSVDEDFQFPFTPDEAEEIEVAIDATQSLILVGCDTEVDEGVIQEGLRAQVVGWAEDTLFHAMVVLLSLEEVSGTIAEVEPTIGGTILTISQEAENEVEILLPDGTPIYLEGDGAIESEFLCEGREVRVVLDPESQVTLTAAELYCQSELKGGVVQESDLASLTLTIDGIFVHVQPTATILDTSGEADTLVSFGAIQVDDRVECFGLSPCSDDESFEAFVVVITEQ
jgi:hypothetical protein